MLPVIAVLAVVAIGVAIWALTHSKQTAAVAESAAQLAANAAARAKLLEDKLAKAGESAADEAGL